jgi:ANTAR domain/PAS fold
VTRHEPQHGNPPPSLGVRAHPHLAPTSLEGWLDVPGSEVAALIAATDWSASPLGDPLGWPPSLRTAAGICLASRFPILLWWGPDLAMVYNDAYRPMLGASKHPRALGAPGREVWTEIWDVIGPMLEQVVSGRGATWSTDQLLVLERNDHPEECYFTFSYSPITTESGEVGGVFCAVTETTERVIGERRLATLADMASLMGAATRADAIRSARSILGANPHDHPAVVVLDAPADGDRAGLAEAVEQQLPRFGAATRARVTDLVRQVSATGEPLNVEGDAGALAAGVRRWHAYALAEPRGQRAGRDAAVVVLGESVHRKWDAALESYATLCVTHVAAATALAEREQHLRRAIDSHEEIGQAVGILVERHRWTPATAFEHLKRSSQDTNTKLREVARQVIESGAEPGRSPS